MYFFDWLKGSLLLMLGKDKKVKFKLQNIQRELPKPLKKFSKSDLEPNFERIYDEARSIFE